MKYILPFVFALSLFSSNAMANAPVERFLLDLVTEAEEIRESRANDNQKRQQFDDLLEEYFDFSTVGAFVASYHWKNMTVSQQEKFLILFRKNLLNKVTGAMGIISFDNFDFIESTKIEGNGNGEFWFVDSTYIKVADVQWRLKKTNIGFKIVDVVFEGISLANTYRSEYSSAMEMLGVERFLEVLQEKVDKDLKK